MSGVEILRHDPGCPRREGYSHTDSAKRASDQVNLHMSAIGLDAVRKWVAIRLADGGSDGTLYDTKRDAVRHQPDEFLCCYVCIPPTGMTACMAESFMRTNRMAYDAGFRLPDPDSVHGGKDIIPRLTVEDNNAQLRRLRKRR
jgi:hypothetical protein